MLRLVNQFDDSDRHVSIATPTCGGCCCCCCCCIATILGTSGLTALNLRNISEKNSSKITKNNLFYIFRGLGISSMLIALIVAFNLSLNEANLGFDTSTLNSSVINSAIPALIVWFALLYVAYRFVGSSIEDAIGWSLTTIALGSLALLGEAAAVIFLIISGFGIVVYPGIIILILLGLSKQFRLHSSSNAQEK